MYTFNLLVEQPPPLLFFKIVVYQTACQLTLGFLLLKQSWHELVESLLLEHYDALYKHKEDEHSEVPAATVHLLDFSAEQLSIFVDQAAATYPTQLEYPTTADGN